MLLTPFEWAYGSVVRTRNARFDRAPGQRLQWPVISVGNLSVGGAGKTPLVIRLAQMLGAAGWHADVLSRGYRRSGKQIQRVDPAETAEQFGDEPLLISRSAAVPVYVGASRYEAGLMAEREAGAGGPAGHVHLLDDGFQHRQLARTVDIVVVHRSDLQARLLPAGRLREPLSSLKRADVVVLREEDAGLEAQLRVHVRSGCTFWKVRRSLSLPNTMKRAVAFCAIARPNEFFAGLQAVAGKMSFRDHHRYTAADMERVARLGQRLGCDAFVTTAKDAVKLESGMRAQLNAVAPLYTAELTIELMEEEVCVRRLVGQLSGRPQI
jgi:tetraacyldisaccharide 4'-kinase